MEERLMFFDEANHKYTDNYGNAYTSVTTAIHKTVEPFDKEYWAKYKARELNTSTHSIKHQWDTVNKHSVGIGNTKHNYLETSIKSTSKFSKAVNIVTINNVVRCFSVYDLQFNSDIGELSIDSFYEKIGKRYPIIFDTIKYYVERGFRIFSEINVYDPNNLVCGTIDVLLVRDSEFVIIDWKTNRNEIKFEAGYYKKDKTTNELTNIWVPSTKYLRYPLDNLQDCVGNHYSLQLSTYARLVELFGYSNIALILFHIRDSFVTNKYGMPAKNEKGIYIIDESKPENVNYHIIKYLKSEATKLIEYVGSNAKVQTQQKLIM